jgi:glucose-1-phosphate cytidylyltransferase
MWEYFHLSGSMTIDGATRQAEAHTRDGDNWRVHLIDTGRETMTGGRIKRLQPWLQDGTFMVTYGDGVCDVDVAELLRFHRAHGRLATVTAVRPPARFGGLVLDGDRVAVFSEKPQAGEGWINGGFMVFEPGVFEFIEGDATNLESHTLEQLAAADQLAAYRHDSFWQCMDTLRDKRLLERLWNEGRAPWKVWS